MVTFRFLLLPLSLLLTASVSAQKLKLSGTVKNSQNTFLQNVNVILMSNDDIPVTKTITNTQGTFNLNASKGIYLLVFEQFGKQLLKKEVALSTDLSIGEITVEDAVTLEGVTVVDHKKIIEQKIDRMVFNVQNSIASQGMSGLDALRNTPLVRIQNDNIAIVGKGKVAVMINDRMLNLSGSELSNYLQSLRSDDIAKIEVITTPPSKYEAQGNSGIINIILKKNPNFGWSGSLRTSYQRNTKNGINNGATINYKSNKISTSLKLRQYDVGYTPVGSKDLLTKNTNIYTAEKREDRTLGLGLNYSIDYNINKKSNLGVIYDFSRSNYTIHGYNSSIYQSNARIDSTLITRSNQNWITPTHTLSAFYDLKLDSVGKILNVVANYLSNAPDKTNNFQTTYIDRDNIDLLKNSSRMSYKIYSGQADLSLPYHWISVETGLKYTYFDNSSDVKLYTHDGRDYVLDPLNTNEFAYEEQNFAAYLSMQKDLGKKWSTKAGVRYEYTSLNAFTPNNGIEKISKRYGNLFPTAYLSFKPNDNHVFTLNYSERIDRPGFQSLNPFRWYTNPYLYYSGNPTLQPSFNKNVEFSYSFKNTWTFSAYNQYTRQGSSSIARLTNGIYSNIEQNSFNQNVSGLNMGYYSTFFKKWETSINANASYTELMPTITEIDKLHAYSLSYSFYNTITLNKESTWFLLLNFWHSLPFISGNTYVKDQLELSPGLRFSLFKKQLQVSAIGSDILKTIKNNGYSKYHDYRENFTQYNDYRRFTLSLTYSFGNTKVTGVKKNVKFEDKNRAY